MVLRDRWQRAIALASMTVLFVSGCSVSTPRDGFTRADAGGATNGAPVADGVTPAGVTADVSSDGGAPTGSGAPKTTGDVAPGSPTSPGAAEDPSASGAGGEPLTASDVGVTEDTITISYSGPFSSFAGALIQKTYDNGFLTWLDDVNARGGVHGRKVVVKKIDNLGTTDGGIAACKEEKTNSSFVVVMSSVDDSEPGCVDAAGLPALVQFAQGVEVPWKVARAIQATPTAGTALAQFVKGGLGAADEKVGLLFLNQQVFKACADGFKAMASELGIDVVASQSIEPNQGSFVSELSRLRSAGAEVVAVIALTEILGVLRDANAIGFQPTWTGVPWTLDELSTVARTQMDQIRGLRMSATADSPAYTAFARIAEAQGKAGFTTLDAQAFGYGLTLEHFLLAAGRNPTRASFVAAIDRGEPFDNGLNPPLRWGDGRSLGSRAWFPAICCDDQSRWKGTGPAQATF